MGLAKSEAEIAERAARFLKAELKRADVTYEELAARLRSHGLNETRYLSPLSLNAERSRLLSNSGASPRWKYPWISLSVLSLFKDLRRPPAPKIFSALLSSFRSAEPQSRMRRRALKNAALLVSARSSDLA